MVRSNYSLSFYTPQLWSKNVSNKSFTNITPLVLSIFASPIPSICDTSITFSQALHLIYSFPSIFALSCFQFPLYGWCPPESLLPFFVFSTLYSIIFLVLPTAHLLYHTLDISFYTPIVSLLLFLNNNQHKQLSQMSHQYGLDIYKIVVVLFHTGRCK